ncbi:hypothetical protein MBLNU230_g2590t1 [Neophaeotheca triangularis]
MTNNPSNSPAPTTAAPAPAARPSPYLPLFTTFRTDLDTHHDRRERIIKASRDITAASKKIIFTLQRTPPAVSGPAAAVLRQQNAQFYAVIAERLRAVEGDLRGRGGLERERYRRQVSGGLQEWVEAVGFEVWCFEGRVVGLEEVRGRLRGFCRGGEGVESEHRAAADVGVDLGYEDYILGLYDLTGEMMRWGVTFMATMGELPSAGASAQEGRNVLTDLRMLRAVLEGLDAGGKGVGAFARDCEGKARVMRQSVEKVEKALYGLVVRGAERPKGWMPDLSAREEVGVEG